MTEFEFHRQIMKNEEYNASKHDEEMEYIDSLIDDAYEYLEKAMSVYLKSDVLGYEMNYTEFKNYVLSKIKDLV